MPLHSDAFRQECLFAHVLFHRVFFDTAYPLHTEAFTQNYSYAERFMHRNTFIQRCFSNTDSPQILFFTKRSFLTDTLTQRFPFTQVLWDASRQMNFYMGEAGHTI